MLKKISAVTVLSATLLFGGVFNTSVDAASSANQTQVQTYSKIYYSVNGKWENNSWDKLNNVLNRYLQDWNKAKWNNQQTPQKQQPKVEQPKQEQPKQAQPKVEQPKQAQPKEEQPKQEQPKVEQPKQEQPKVEQPKQEQPKVEQPVQQAPAKQQPVAKEEPKQSQGQTYQLSEFEQQVFDLTNNERTKNGLAPLKVDLELSRVAREKSQDMASKNYFAHNSPTYGSPFDMMKSYGISYKTAGENIAKGQRTPAEVVNAWMNSAGHRANILNGKFTHIGIGYIAQGNHWTQQFIGK